MFTTGTWQLTVCPVLLFVATPCRIDAQNQGAIHLDLTCVSDNDSTIEFISTLINESDAHSAILIGLRLGNGRAYHPTTLSIEAVQGGAASATRFEYLLPAILGRADPWIVPLPSGARYSWAMGIDKFYSVELNRSLNDVEQPLEVLMQLESIPIQDIAFLEGFVGILRSQVVRVPSDCRNAA